MKKIIKNNLGYSGNLFVYQDKEMFNYSVDTILLGNFFSINRNVSKEYLLNYLVENFVVEEKNTNSFKEIFQNLFENKEISKESVTKEELKEEVKKEIIDDIKEEVSEIVENQGDKVVKKD